jgi:hypothetical protein
MNKPIDAAEGLPTPEQYALDRAEWAHNEFCRHCEEAGISAFVPGFPFRRRQPEHQAAWVSVCETVLRHWMETEFRNALRDREKILEAAAAMAVARDENQPAEACLAHAIATFVIGLIDPEVLKIWVTPNPTAASAPTQQPGHQVPDSQTNSEG